jgi:indole-3-glycerol phosphate synthase
MSGFLDAMAAASEQRVRTATSRLGERALRQQAFSAMRAPRLTLHGGFDLIAELKLRSPAQGQLGANADDLEARVTSYARGGAAAVSVLTEPSRFDGDLAHLERAVAALRPLDVPAMRKDFLVAPYQVYEARAAGAGGVLLIIRMVSRERLVELLDCAAECGLFVLLEAFDQADLKIARELAVTRRGRDEQLLVGVNSRDLQTLQVVPERLLTLAPELPTEYPRVAESGVASVAEVEAVARAGYSLALIGTALMARGDPQQLARELLQAGRAAAAAVSRLRT